MLIKIHELLKKYSLQIKGILHIGAHMCEEYGDYIRAGVKNEKIIWVEGNPNLAEKIKKMFSNRIIYHAVVSDKDNQEVVFHVSNNGQSSSILDFGTHKRHYRNIHYIKHIKQKTKTIKTLYQENKIDPKIANFVNIDIQGAELLALKGMGDLLNNFDYLYLEVNKEEVYKKCALIGEIDEYVKKFGLYRVDTKMTNCGWGDSFYMRK